ncbi:MAG: hypothetical protein Q9195_001727 [Heterodermia aff. obscurata]
MGSYEHVRGSSPARSEYRKMSLNPVAASIPPAKEEPVGAFEVSKSKRIRKYKPLHLTPISSSNFRAVQVAVAVIYCLFSAGVVFGYAAIKPVFVKEGVYGDYCSSDVAVESERVCYEQEIRYGPRVSSIIGSVLLAVGAIFLALASDLPFDGYIPGYIFLALGGPFAYISAFQLSNTFPNHSGLILALLTGAFDSSSAIFLFYRLAYEASNGAFKPQKFFLVYLTVPAFLLVVQIFLMPSRSYKTVGELVTHAENPEHDAEPAEWYDRNHNQVSRVREERREHRESIVSEVTALLGSKGASKQQEEEKKRKEISGVYGAQHGRSAFQQIRSPWFILITGFTVVQMVRINYFVATIRTQYEYMFNDDQKAKHVNNVFDIALPLGGLISIPFIGLILDNTSTAFVLGLLVFVATAIGVLGVLPYLWASYANVVLFTLYRPFYYTAVSDYTAKVFGFHTFGKVYGLIICLAGILNFIQSALDAATHNFFKGDPIPINVILIGVALVVGTTLVSYVWHKSRNLARDHLEEEAEDAPEADETVTASAQAEGPGEG